MFWLRNKKIIFHHALSSMDMSCTIIVLIIKTFRIGPVLVQCQSWAEGDARWKGATTWQSHIFFLIFRKTPKTTTRNTYFRKMLLISIKYTDTHISIAAAITQACVFDRAVGGVCYVL